MTNTTIHQPHDKLFKNSMANIRVARDFFEEHLPQRLLNQIDLNTLKLEKNTFIDSRYKAGEVDLLYSVQQQEGNLVYLHLHCEHQSDIEKLAAFRLLVYKTKLMEEHKKQHPDAPFPIIYSILVYTGEKAWDAPLDILDLMSGPRELAKEVLFQPYQLIDVQRIPDDEMKKHFLSGLMEFALKYRKAQDFAKFLKDFLPWVDEVNRKGSSFAYGVLEYIIDGIEEGDKILFFHEIEEHLNTEIRGKTMTIAEQLRQEGRQEGEITMLNRQLKLRFRDIPADYQKRIEQADAETLLKWGDQILTANSLEEVFV